MSDGEKKLQGAAADPTKRFQPGQSGNPSGRSKGLEKQGRAFLRGKTYVAKDGTEYVGADALFQFLWEIAADGTAKDRDRIAAVKEFADRAYGRAKQTVAITESDDADQAPDMRDLTDEELRVLAALDEVNGGRPTEH